MSFPGYTAGKTLHLGRSTVVCRAEREADGARVVLKYPSAEHPSLSEVLRYRHELDLLRRLEGPHVVRALALERFGHRVVLVTEDFDGVPLREHLAAGPPSLERFLGLAIALVRAIGFVHEKGVVHRDVNPTNALVDPRTGAVKLIDFGIATLLSREVPALDRPEHVEGTFEFMSPEQTGRTSRPQDHRSDFYSLGATLYALARGQPPFGSQDFLTLIHHHLAKEPSPLDGEVPWIPETVSRIVDKLLAKSAEHRYQSALGLVHDLEECLRRLRENGHVAPFELGARDTPPRFEIPHVLLGRAAEISILLRAFDRAATGRAELLLVGGRSGIGKSALVKEVHTAIAARRGYFASGKYDQYGRGVPFSAVARAFAEMVQHVSMEPPESVDRWRAEILEALGANAGVVLDIVPSLEALIGPAAPVVPLPPAEAKSRFDAAIHAFVRALARPERPLVIFLDDLQWADLPSLDLLESLLASAQTRSLLVIGAYRDNEVDASHPLLLAAQQIQESGAAVHGIDLGPIGLGDAESLVAATLRCSREEASPLAALLHQRTAGNPFFLVQLLRALHGDGLFAPDVENAPLPEPAEPDLWEGRTRGRAAGGGQRWTWDLRRIQDLGLTDDVVDLMTSRLQKLPEPTKHLLRLASCIGSQFDLSVLSRASGSSPQRATEALWPALSEGLILPLSEEYELFLDTGSARETDVEARDARRILDARVERAVSDGGLRVGYRFLHDRVQQAAYALIPADLRKAEHLKLGRLLLGDASAELPAERIFEVVPHLNLGLELVTDHGERGRIARLNYRAGLRAKGSAAYKVAASHFAVAMDLVGPDIWARDHDLALGLHRERAECEYITGRFALSDELATAAIARSRTALDKAAVYATRIQLHLSEGSSYRKGVALGIEALGLLGVAIPDAPGGQKAALAAERAAIARLVEGREIASLHDRPRMSDPKRRAAMELLMQTWTAAYFAHDVAVQTLTMYLLVRTSLEHGHTSASAFGYVTYGVDLCLHGDARRGYDFGLLGMQITERYPDPGITVRAGNIFAHSLNPYFNALETNLKYYRRTYQVGPQVGETIYVAWAVLFIVLTRTMKGDPLPEVQGEAARYMGFLEQANNRDVLLSFRLHRQVLRALQGKTKGPTSLDEDGAPAEAEMLAEHEKNGFHAGELFHALSRTALHVIFGEHRAALAAALTAEKHIKSSVGMVVTTNHHFHQSLALAALLGEMDPWERARSLETLDRNLEKLRGWAETAPENFAHRRDLVAAEIARCRGEHDAAARLYDLSLDGARAAGFTHDEALAAETAARAWRDRGVGRVAQLYTADAIYAYARWGADAKVAQLRERHGQLAPPEHAAAVTSSESSSAGRSARTLASTVDLASLMKAAQAISGEIERPALIDRLMRITLENAGARRGWLVLDGAKGLTVIASASIDEAVRLAPTPIDAAPDLPVSVVRYVVKTREPLVLGAALREGPFRADPRLIERGCKSVAAVPLLRQGRLAGVLHLENDLVEGAFTPERVEVLQLLAAQAAISLENASLYEELEARVAERTAALADSNRRLQESLSQLQGAQRQLGDASRRAGMAEIATSVLHNIGNVLNSVNVSCRMVTDSIRQSRAGGVAKTARLLAEQEDLAAFFSEDDRGKRLPEYLSRLADALSMEQSASLAELTSLQRNIDHIKAIVGMQQSHAKHGGVVESLSLEDLVEDAIRLNAAANDRYGVEIARDFDPLPAVETDRHKLFQIVMNLLSNARHAVQAEGADRRRVAVRVKQRDPVWIAVEVEDTGSGITRGDLVQIFSLGFTTKKDGHGFGLHGSSCSAIEMGGTLTAHSDGPGRGALFRLLLPLLGKRL